MSIVQERVAQRHAAEAEHGIDWRKRAACRDADPELFFALTNHQIRAAKQICRTCPARVRCRQWADEHGITYGVWGAESEEERRSRLVANAVPSRPIRTCPQCGRGFAPRRPEQRYCSHDCHNLSMAKVLNDCGTTTGARRHRKRGEPLDDACRHAEALWRAQHRARRKEAAA